MGARLIKLRNRTIAQPATEAPSGPYPFVIISDGGDLYGAHDYASALSQAADCGGTVYEAQIGYRKLSPDHIRVITFDKPSEPGNTALSIKKRQQARNNQRQGARKTKRQRELDARIATPQIRPGDDDFATTVANIADKYIPRSKRRRPEEITDNRVETERRKR